MASSLHSDQESWPQKTASTLFTLRQQDPESGKLRAVPGETREILFRSIHR